MGLTWAGMERNIAIMIGSIRSLRPLMTSFINLTSRTFSGLVFSIKKSPTESYEIGSKGSKYDLDRDGMGGRKPLFRQNGAENTRTSTTTRSNISQERILPT